MKTARPLLALAPLCYALVLVPQLLAQAAFDRHDFNSSSAPVASVAYDFDHDGNMDLAVVNSGSSSVSIFMGRGDGSFTPLSDIATGANPTAIAIGDFNRDGIADLAVLNRSDDTISILLGNGDGTFTAGASVPVAGNSLVVKDFNRDGTDDLATVSGNTIYVVLGNGDGTFGPSSAYPGGPFSNSTSITSGDFNGDGIADLAVANCCDPDISAAPVGRYAVLLGNGDGTFAAANFLNAAGPISLATADLNNDGLDDLASSYAGCHTPCVGVTLLFSNGDGTFSNGPNVPFDYTAHGSAPGSVAFGDFDRNGRLDIATTLAQENRIGLFLQKDDGSGFLHDIDFTVGNAPSSITVADFNNDGRPDLAITDRGSNAVTILLNADHAVVLFTQFGGYPLNNPVRFSDQQVGTTSNPQTVTLTNTGNIPLTISAVDVNGDYSQNNDCGSTVAPGASCTFNIFFTPAATGQRDGSLTISDNAVDSPQIIRLTGNGTP